MGLGGYIIINLNGAGARGYYQEQLQISEYVQQNKVFSMVWTVDFELKFSQSPNFDKVLVQ